MLRKIGNSKTIGDIEKQKIISVNITSFLPWRYICRWLWQTHFLDWFLYLLRFNSILLVLVVFLFLWFMWVFLCSMSSVGLSLFRSCLESQHDVGCLDKESFVEITILVNPARKVWFHWLLLGDGRFSCFTVNATQIDPSDYKACS